MEAEADSAVVNRATNTLTFDGNVTGFYFLAPDGTTTDAAFKKSFTSRVRQCRKKCPR